MGHRRVGRRVECWWTREHLHPAVSGPGSLPLRMLMTVLTAVYIHCLTERRPSRRGWEELGKWQCHWMDCGTESGGFPGPPEILPICCREGGRDLAGAIFRLSHRKPHPSTRHSIMAEERRGGGPRTAALALALAQGGLQGGISCHGLVCPEAYTTLSCSCTSSGKPCPWLWRKRCAQICF